VFFLIGYRNRLVVLIDWAWNYWTFARHARVVAQPEAKSRAHATSDAGQVPPGTAPRP
jgi:NADH dehydrogenase